jgi:cytochrome c553
VNGTNFALILFTCFAFGLPLWAMQANDYDGRDINGCSGECYEQWKEETGGVVAVSAAKAAAKAAAPPAELGKMAYIGCVACHGAAGEGGVGPQLAGQTMEAIADKLTRYKNGETVGSQSALMWSQASQLGSDDIENLAAYIVTL